MLYNATQTADQPSPLGGANAMNTTTDIPYGKIYLIKRKRSGKVIYVGQASRGKGDRITREGRKWEATSRIKGHKNAASNGGGRKQPIDQHMREHGVDKFLFVTLPRHYATKADLNEAEKRYIKRFNTFNGDNPNAFNMTRGGQSGRGFHCEATLQKMSDARKEYHDNMTPAQKKQRSERLSAAQANRTPAQKKQQIERRRATYANMSPAQKKQRSERISASGKKREANMTPAQKKQRSERLSAVQANRTPAQKKQISERLSASQKVRAANETPAKKKQRLERMRVTKANWAPAQKKQISERMRAAQANMSPAQKKQRRERLSAAHANMSPAKKAEINHVRLKTRHNKNPNRETCVTHGCLGRPRKRTHLEGRCWSCFEQAWMENPSIGTSYAKCKARGCNKPGYTAGLCSEHRNAKSREERRAKRNANAI